VFLDTTGVLYLTVSLIKIPPDRKMVKEKESPKPLKKCKLKAPLNLSGILTGPGILTKTIPFCSGNNQETSPQRELTPLPPRIQKRIDLRLIPEISPFYSPKKGWEELRVFGKL